MTRPAFLSWVNLVTGDALWWQHVPAAAAVQHDTEIHILPLADIGSQLNLITLIDEQRGQLGV